MTDQGPVHGFEPPRAPIEGGPPPPRRPQTAGYLVGAIAQLALGGYWTYRSAVGAAGGTIGLLGVLLLVLGVSAVVKYRRSRRG
jgi:hypothetical protein